MTTKIEVAQRAMERCLLGITRRDSNEQDTQREGLKIDGPTKSRCGTQEASRDQEDGNGEGLCKEGYTIFGNDRMS